MFFCTKQPLVIDNLSSMDELDLKEKKESHVLIR